MAVRKKKKNFINLLPKDEFEASLLGRILKWILSSFRVIVITVELVVIMGFLSRFWLDTQNADLSDELEQKEALVLSYRTFEREFRAAQEKLLIVSEAIASDKKVSPTLGEVISVLPADAQLISFQNSAEDGLIIRTASLSEQSASQFMVNLAAAGFSDLSITEVESRADSALIFFTVKSISKEIVEEYDEFGELIE